MTSNNKLVKPSAQLLNSNNIGMMLAKPLTADKKLSYKDSMIPLKSVHHEVDILQTIANVQIHLKYENQIDFPIEAIFYFAISSQACFHSLEAQIGNRIVKGQVKPKEQAKEEYKKGIQEGKTMIYSEIDSELNDTIQLNLGNIEKGDIITVKLGYIESLKIDPKTKQYEFIIPFTLTPRYQSYRQNKYSYSNAQYVSGDEKQNQAVYKWTINVSIRSPKNPIINLDSPSHKVIIKNEKEFATLTFEKEEVPNKDFVLHFSTQELFSILISNNAADDEQSPYCAFINVLVNKEEKEVKKESEQQFQNKNYDKGEFIFIIDRSGSMSGDRINMAKQSLVLFLKSLPSGSYFNIISFGSQFYPMHASSVKATDQTIKDSIEKVMQFNADMGGTEIFTALSFIFDSILLLDGVPRNIFLLTDGDVSDTKKILGLIQRFSTTVNIYTLGIGSGASSELITQAAALGNGTSEMVNDNNLINEKVMQLLKSSLAKKYYNFVLTYNKNQVEKIVPDPNQISFLRENECLQTFVFLKKGVQETEIALKINNAEVFKQKINVNDQQLLVNAKDNCCIHKLGTFKFVKKILYNYMQDGNILDDVYYAKQVDFKDMQKEILDLCIKYQLLTELTAFICEVKDMKDEQKQQKLEPLKVDVPLIKQNEQQQLSQISQMVMETKQIMTTNIEKLLNRSESLDKIYDNISAADLQVEAGKFYLKSAELRQKSCCSGGFHFSKKDSYNYQNDNLKMAASNQVSQKEQNSKRQLVDILVAQKSEGYWVKMDFILNLIVVSKEVYEQSIPAKFKSNEQMWFNIIVIFWLENYQQKTKVEWELIVKKTKKWLLQQGVVYDNEIGIVNNKIFNPNSL